MQKKTHIKKGDMVQVITGSYKGKEGRVIEVVRETNRALVEEVNMIKRHTKPNAQYPDGGIINKEAPIHLSNLMYIDPKSGKPSKAGRKLDGKDNKVSQAKIKEESK
ncbi:MAG: 50S ribosomal protein L24 [Bacteroidetes bacterium]|nr:MAG: 50S ribosomal protein L24 [Bacteroidota bacterium]